MDVPANSWIDVRMEMPAAEIPDLPIAEPEPTTSISSLADQRHNINVDDRAFQHVMLMFILYV